MNIDHTKLVADLLSQFPNLDYVFLDGPSEPYKPRKRYAPDAKDNPWRQAHPMLESVLLGISLSGVEFCPQLRFYRGYGFEFEHKPCKETGEVKIYMERKHYYFTLKDGCNRSLQNTSPYRHAKVHQRFEELMKSCGHQKRFIKAD